MKKYLVLLIALVCAVAGAQTFPVQNLQVNGTSSFTGTMSGAGLNSHDANVNHMQTVANVAALRALSCVPGLLYTNQGYTTIADGGNSVYVCNGSDTTSTDNGFNIIAAANSYRYYLQTTSSQISVKQAGVKCDGSTNDSTAIATVYAYMKAIGGGVVNFPNGGLCQLYLDLSTGSGARNPDITFNLNNSTLRPVSTGQTNGAIVYINNSANTAGYNASNITFINGTIDARVSSTGTGDVNYGVYVNGADFRADRVIFEFAKVGGFYGSYVQYSKFHWCQFNANNVGSGSYGAYIGGPDINHASNEVVFERPIFFSNYNAIFVGGAYKVRIDNPTVQANTYGILLDQDLSGNGATATSIDGAYFEVNSGADIKIGTANSTQITNFATVTNGETFLISSTTYNLSLINGYGNAAVTSIGHPAGNGDTASLTWKGVNFDPTLNLTHAGPTYLDMQSAAAQTAHNDNMMLTANQASQTIPVYSIADWNGTKVNVSKATTTSLFSLTQATAATSQYRVSMLVVELYSWDDTGTTAQYGYSGSVQRYDVMISNNTSGAPQVSITAENTGTPLGINTGTQNPGNIALSASVSGQVITFSENWPGAGSGSASIIRMATSYLVRGANVNNLYMTRL